MVTQTHFSDIFATLSKFREEGFLCDTLIMSSDKELQAHGLLLAAVSPVFKSAFTDSSKHGRYVINLSKVDSSVIEIALHFIYTGKLLLPHVYTQTNELLKLFAALQVIGIQTHKLNGCEMKFKSPEDTTLPPKPKPPNLGETPVEIKLHNKPQLVDISALKTLQNNTEKVKHMEETTKQKESNVPDDSKASQEEPLQQSTSPPVSDVMEEVVIQDESVKAVEDTPQVRRQKQGRPRGSKYNACSVQSDLRAKTTQSRGSQSIIRKKDKISPQTKMKQTFNPNDTKQMNGSPTGLRFDKVEMTKSSPEKVAMSVVDGVEGLQTRVVKEVAPNESQPDGSPSRSINIHLIPSKKSPANVDHIQEVVALMENEIEDSVNNTDEIVYSHLSNSSKTQQLQLYPEIGSTSSGSVSGPSANDEISGNQDSQVHMIQPPGQVACVQQRKRRLLLTSSKLLAFILDQNQLVHTDETPHKCNICNKVFSLKGSLKRHEKLHTGIRPHLCELCGKGFFRKTALHYHMHVHQKEREAGIHKEGEVYSCSLCVLKLNRSGNLRKHVQKVHLKQPRQNDSKSREKKSLLCELCGKDFACVGSLEVHKMQHTGEKPFMCSICGRAFVVKAQLQYHALLHTGIKPFVCQICGKGFVLELGLTQHARSHSDERP